MNLRRKSRMPDDAGGAGSMNDLSFLLIIFFIVIAGFNVNKGFLMKLPEKTAPKTVYHEDLLKCILKSDGSLLIEDTVVSAADLEQIVKTKQNSYPNMVFFLIISPDTPYQSVISVIYEIRRLNVENFSFKMDEDLVLSGVRGVIYV